ncbi:SAF domain-containing protein [Yinghuangia soli]|uniref:SAF domain-containing protein n=1 Tax=Yinghuangia soli TaxID=2908204 RepID=A0AA41Q426_9ACTN|nr:SAF domain-containing protein [Yinghuangia soli]MCF2531158.1 SAF domain-containing protein [Yinghuangia soli]
MTSPSARLTGGPATSRSGRPLATSRGSNAASRPNPPGSRRRRTGLVWAGLALAVLSALAFVLFARQLDDRRDVLVLTRDVPRGEALQSGDLRVARVGVGSDVSVVLGSERSSVTGQATTRNLVSGQLLQPGDTEAAAQYPPAGKAEIAIVLKPGAAPPAVREGQRAAVLEGPAVSTPASPGPPPAVVVGEVVRVDAVPDSSGSTIVTLLVDTAATRTLAVLREPHLAVLSPSGGEAP